MPTKHEERKVLTLWGHRGWHIPDDDDYNTGSLNRGYRSLNTVIEGLAQRVTIHSVSYSSIPIPALGVCHLIHVSATIVYSGNLDIQGFHGVKVDRTKKTDSTVFEVHL
jgi:hypothetical protein